MRVDRSDSNGRSRHVAGRTELALLEGQDHATIRCGQVVTAAARQATLDEGEAHIEILRRNIASSSIRVQDIHWVSAVRNSDRVGWTGCDRHIRLFGDTLGPLRVASQTVGGELAERSQLGVLAYLELPLEDLEWRMGVLGSSQVDDHRGQTGQHERSQQEPSDRGCFPVQR